MLNQNTIFRQQLKRILTNVNKKHSILRKQIMKTCQVFENDHLPVFPYEVCFGLFKQLPQTNSISASIAFLPFLQNVINLGFANEEMTKEIIVMLTHIKSLPKFYGLENQSKLQQILLLLVSKNTIRLSNLTLTHNIINILFALDNNKHRNIWIKTLAILTQISLLYLNELSDDPNNLRRQRFFSYLTDIIRMAQGQNVKWLVQGNQPFLFMSLLSQLLDQKYIKQHKNDFGQPFTSMMVPLRKFITKLYEGFCYQIPSSPSSKSWEFPVQNKLVICLRVCCKISKLYESNYELLQQVIKVVTEKGHNSLKVIGYECINYLFSSSQWMHSMLQSQSGDLFHFLMTTLFNTVKNIQSQLKEGPQLYQKFDLEKQQRIFMSNGLEFHQLELSSLNEIKLIIKSVDQISFTFFSIYSDIYQIPLDAKINKRPPLQKTYKFCHKTIFQILKSVIGKQIGQETLQSLLKIAERFINLAGVFGDSGTSGVFIKLMCRYCLPAGQKPIGQRHVQINKMILSTANCLGNLFSTGCWVTVWKALQNYSLYYNRYLMGKEELQAERQNDVQILYASMESIFTQSPMYQNTYLLNILQSLVQVTYQCLENNFSQQHRKIFAFQRIQQIFKLNLFRIQKIWQGLISSLLILATSKVQSFRLASLSLINSLIPIALHYLHLHKEALGSTMTQVDYEAVILQPWISLSASPFIEIRAQLAIAVGKLVIDYGHIMTHGWKSILIVVKQLQDLTSLQAIVETFLDKINPYIMEIIEIIDQVERSLSDSNQKYLCLTLIWAIGDHAHRHSQSQVLRKIYTLLLQPQEMFALGTQARHSSFYILAQLLVHNCNEKQEQFWEWIFALIQKFYGYSLDKCGQVRERMNFQQILKNLLTNLLKIYRKCFLLLDNGHHQQFIKDKLDNFFCLITRFLSFRQSQIYQSTLKQVRQMLAIKREVILQLQQYNHFLQKLTEIYFIQNDNKILKSLITYLPIDIYDILSHSLPKVHKKLSLIYKLVEKIFLLRLQAEEKDIKIHQLRIFFEEKVFIQFWKKLNNYLIQTNQQLLLKEYIQLFTMTLHKLILYEDYVFLSKMLPFLNVINERHCCKLNNDHTIDLYAAVFKIKWSENWRIKHGKSKEVPIWLISSNQTIKLGYLLDRLCQDNENCLKAYQKYLYTFSQLVGKTLPLSSKEQQQSSDFLTYYYDSECSLLYFIIQHYLLSSRQSLKITSIQQSHILSTISEGISHFKENDKTSRSKHVYDILFKMIQRKDNMNEIIIKRQVQMIKMITEQIIKVFQLYLKLISEGKSENTDIQFQVKYLMKKLLQIQIDPSANLILQSELQSKIHQLPQKSSAIYKHPKALLCILTPVFLKLIQSPNNQIRLIIIQVLQLAHTSLVTEILI